MKVICSNAGETRKAGANLAYTAKPGDVFSLSGGLGAGKTEFVRGFVCALDPSIEVRSPTFTLVNIYPAPLAAIYHFDFYRLKSVSELYEIGFYEYAGSDGICLVEWADMYPQALPSNTRYIKFVPQSENVREIEID
jgi:tRNA threonylcarbamoyladenosine biosynthesis protein TsaE